MNPSDSASMTTVRTIAPDDVAATSATGNQAQLQAQDLRQAPPTHVVAVTSGSDDGNESVAGEEDPGAAPDLLGSTADWPERWCRWPKDWDELAPSSLRSLPPRGASVSWPMTWRS